MKTELKLGSIEKIKLSYDRLKALDAEIIELEKAAILIAEKKTEIEFTLNVNDPEETEKAKCTFDEDGSLANPNGLTTSWVSIFDSYTPSRTEKKKFTHSIKNTLTERGAFLILGALMQEKNAERKLLLSKLEKYGFNI
jgi:hypothetical protein